LQPAIKIAAPSALKVKIRFVIQSCSGAL